MESNPTAVGGEANESSKSSLPDAVSTLLVSVTPNSLPLPNDGGKMKRFGEGTPASGVIVMSPKVSAEKISVPVGVNVSNVSTTLVFDAAWNASSSEKNSTSIMDAVIV